MTTNWSNTYEDIPTSKLEQSAGSDPTCVTFTFIDEDHTLGNGLRYVLMRDTAVEFCGYSIPHPSENKMNLRVQTNGTKSAPEALRDALLTLRAMANHVNSSFKADLHRWDQEHATNMDTS